MLARPRLREEEPGITRRHYVLLMKTQPFLYLANSYAVRLAEQNFKLSACCPLPNLSYLLYGRGQMVAWKLNNYCSGIYLHVSLLYVLVVTFKMYINEHAGSCHPRRSVFPLLFWNKRKLTFILIPLAQRFFHTQTCSLRGNFNGRGHIEAVQTPCSRFASYLKLVPLTLW